MNSRRSQTNSFLYAGGTFTFIFIVPELKLVAAFAGKNHGKREQLIPLQILSQEIVPSLIEG
ncbi:MAG: hypothetical protein HWE25_16415 [Alphaproteobacteria bacterium]|nr:hypothetical protein [Alphaproteobacteria bacterium]